MLSILRIHCRCINKRSRFRLRTKFGSSTHTRGQACKIKEAIKGRSGELGAAAVKEVCILGFEHPLYKRWAQVLADEGHGSFPRGL